MKKRFFYIALLLCVIIGYCCLKNRESEIVLSEEEFVKYEYILQPDIWENMKINIIEFDIPKNSSCESCCVYQGIVYYSVEYTDYLIEQTGTEVREFKPEYNTQIRAYDCESGEDRLLFQYQKERCIHITDIQANDKYVIWEEYIDGTTWGIRGIELTNIDHAKLIINGEECSSVLWSVTPNLRDTILYWYDQNENGDIYLSQYDLKNEKWNVMIEKCNLASPFEHVSVNEDIITTYQLNESGGYDIIRWKTALLKQKERLSFTSSVAQPIADSQRCIWGMGYDVWDNKIYHYCYKNREKEYIESDNYFSYALISRYMIVNQKDKEEGLYCYDLENKKYGKLELQDGYSYWYTFQSPDGGVYCEIKDEETLYQSKQKLLYLSL